jgi:uncharacterized membrane protein
LVFAAPRFLRWPILRVEQYLWFLSPLLLLPLLPMLFCDEAWRGRHEALLPPLVLLLLFVETLVLRALSAVPEEARITVDLLRRRLPEVWRRHGALIVVVGASLGYAIFMSFYTVQWHHRLKTHNFDLSINNNLSFTALHGEFMMSRVAMPTKPESYIAAHVKLGTYVFLPIYALIPRPETLLVIQSSLLGLGGIPLFAFAKRYVSVWAAALIVLAYLCYYPMHGANYTEVQYVPHATFFIFAMAWAAEVRRWILFSLAFLAALAMREDVSVGLAVLGGFWLLSGHRPKAGTIVAIVSAAWFVFLRFHIMEKAGSWWFPKMYQGLFSPGETTFGSVLKTLLTNPVFALSKIITKKKVFYLLHLLAPLAFLPARRWYLWAAFISGGILTLLVTDYDPPITFSFQYVMFWTPYFFLAAPVAIAAIRSRPDFGAVRAKAALSAMALSSAVLTYNWGAFARHEKALKGGFGYVNFGMSQQERERYRLLLELKAMIPPDASVAATENVGPHVSSRRVFYTMRSGPHGAEYILASRRELRLGRTKSTLKEGLKSKTYGVVARRGDMALLKKGHDTAGNERLLKDWNL